MKNKEIHWKGARFKGNRESREAYEAFDIKLEKLDYINPQYELKLPTDTTIDTRGEALLLIGELIPRNESLPSFFIRWDEKEGNLNIDMCPDQEGWKQEIHGYEGHHPPKCTGQPKRICPIKVSTPELRVIDAVISFCLQRKMGLSVDISCILE